MSDDSEYRALQGNILSDLGPGYLDKREQSQQDCEGSHFEGGMDGSLRLRVQCVGGEL